MYLRIIISIVLSVLVSCGANKKGNDINLSNSSCDSLNNVILGFKIRNDSLETDLKRIYRTESKIDYSLKLTGKFVSDNNVALCAGYTFLENKDLVLWTNEMACLYPDTLKLVWMANDIFLYRDINSPIENEPDRRRTWIRKIISFDGNKLVLKSYSTSGGKYYEEIYKFKKVFD